MTTVFPKQARDFAVRVVQQIRDAGFEAVWAGGCVRDQLLGREPKDYDVATSATPDEVCRVLGRRRTLPIGVSFGVITVLGPKSAGQIEVATFRQDASYSDGRHPDMVSFSTASEDAQRRDFTINGLFYDPLQDQIIDYVDGVKDLHGGIIRAIGDAALRFNEDKLRMIRAIRFAALFDFSLDPATLAAIQEKATEICVVSAERIAVELRQILVHSSRVRGMELLRRTGLFRAILPESERVGWHPQRASAGWERLLRTLAALLNPTFPLALATVLRELALDDLHPEDLVNEVCQRWRLSNDEKRRATWLVQHEAMLRRASDMRWPHLQRILIETDILELVELASLVEFELTGQTIELDFCRNKLSMSNDRLNPEPLITGDDLIAHGIPPGKEFRKLLNAVRDAQLDELISTKADALELVDRLLPS